MKKNLLFGLCVLVAGSALAGNMDFTYNLNNAPAEYYGTSKKENYGIAIYLDNPALKGASLTSISVPFPGDPANYENPKGFLTTELKLERVNNLRVNVADIAEVKATIADGMLTATFDEPYVMTEKPIYVGYSFEVATLDDASKKPVAVVSGLNENGFWFYSSRTQMKWANYYDRSELGMQSAMIVHFSGDFPSETAGISLSDRTILLTGDPQKYNFNVVNGGSAEIKKIDYSWKMDELSGEGTYEFETPVPGALGAYATASFELPAINERGYYSIEVSIDKVNGKENPNLAKESSAEIVFTPILPVNRPLVEEYTGTWCGWCPRGYAALEYLKEEFGEDFVAAAWHAGDPMTITSSFPNQVGGYPASFINRTTSPDPGELVELWPAAQRASTTWAIECAATFDDESKTQLTAKVKFSSLDNLEDVALTVGYILIGDGLTSPSYAQTNNYAGNAAACATLPGEWGDFFLNAGSPAMGLIYNDVVVGSQYAAGIKNSAPTTIKAFEEYTHEVTFPVNDLHSSFDLSPLPVDMNKLRVIAMILDSRGRVINSVSSAYAAVNNDDSIVGIEDADKIVDTIYYDLQGNRLTTPAKGICVRLQKLNDGRTVASKVIVR